MGREEKRRRHADDEDDDIRDGVRDLKMQKLQTELEEVKSRLARLIALKPHEFVNGPTGKMPTIVTHHEPLLHYELDTLKKQNDLMTKKVFDLEKELSRKSAHAGQDLLLDTNKKLIAEKEKLVNENKELQHKLQVYTLFSDQLKKEYNETKQKVVILEEENERLASQVQLWQQMQLSATLQQHQQQNMDELPDVQLQSSPMGSPLPPEDD